MSWHGARPTSSTQRGYGSQWQRARKAYLQKHPLCRECEKEGRITVANVVDHIRPHKGDMTLFWQQDNWQPLCKAHHDLKTVLEDGGLRSGAHTHPEWLPTPACPVVFVSGPPGSGKTTYCRKHAGPNDTIIDLDECFRTVCGVHGHEADRAYLSEALRLRNRMIADLASKHTGRAFVIVSAPAHAEQAWWVDRLRADHVHLDPGQEVCLARVSASRRIRVVQWYEKAKANHWVHPSVGRTQVLDESGWPVG
jgi:5-methylcytosine-specific restriction enzyme A